MQTTDEPKAPIGVGMSKPTWHLDDDQANNVARTGTPAARHVRSMTESRLVNSTFDRTNAGKCGLFYGG